MLAYKTTVLGLVALFGLSALAEQDCRAVPYTEFLATKEADVNAELGPKGLYAKSLDGSCIYVDAAASGDFAKHHSQEYAELIDGIKEDSEPIAGLDFMSTTNPLVRRQLQCNQLCGNRYNQRTCVRECPCKFWKTQSLGGGSVDTFKCQY